MNLQIHRQATIEGDFEGFDDQKLFKLDDGTYWVQTVYQYWYHYAYRPSVVIYTSGGRFFLGLDGSRMMAEVREAHGVIESQIDDAFSGWDGTTEYRLTNGQVWKQSRYKYQYKYAYRPVVLIFDGQMHVAGTSAYVQRVR